MEWLKTHADVLNVTANFLILLVWLFYAQLLYLNFKRQRRPRLLINRGGSKDKDKNALCLISNMSSEAIYTTHIIAALYTEAAEFTCDVTEYEAPGEIGQDVSLSDSTRQGPLSSGGFSHIGTFNNIIRRVANAHGIEMRGDHPAADTRFLKLEIRIVAVYGSEDTPVGAYRSFRFIEGGDYLVPESYDTKRLSKWWWGQRRLHDWIHDQAEL